MNTAGKNNVLVNSLMPLNSAVKNVRNNSSIMAKMPAMPAMPDMSSGWVRMLLFGILLAVFITVIVLYKNEIQDSWNRTTETINNYFNPPPPPPPASPAGTPKASASSTPVTHSSPGASTPESESVVNKILPSTGREVFSVSANKFTYNDAEPLCKALGAELATYEQVKEAWIKGADWCNYGWVKGQMAVYPTQKETWDKAQSGPEDERMVCGSPGINGGFFDNPEMRFGVTCYGSKPDQSKHDEDRVASIPKSPATLLFDKKVSEYRGQSDHLGVLPFSTGKWSTF